MNIDYEKCGHFLGAGKLLSHTIDPKTLRPINHQLGSVTVIANDCMTADALATAFMVLGTEAAYKLINEIENCEALFIERLADGQLKEIMTDGFSKYIIKLQYLSGQHQF